MVASERHTDEVTVECTSTAEATPGRHAGLTARLTVVHPAKCRVVRDLDAAPVTLGRQPPGHADLLVPHPTLSRAHVEIRFDASSNRHWALDLGSRNGTYLQRLLLGTLPRPLDDGMVLRIGDVLAVYEVERDTSARHDPPEVERAAIPGDALALRALRAGVLRASQRVNPTLVIGETGTGKERIAAELHRLSRRRGELVVANCAALSPALIESQLFGHERGAFTGANQRSSGLFRAAEGGTLVLDEIGELPLELQAKLLRAIESGEIMAVGSSRIQTIDTWVIGVTNRDLAREVEAGRFRRDLYARLALTELRVPALRDRKVDLLGWLDRLLGPTDGSFAAALSTGAAEAILLHAWPDNLRGLHRLVLDHNGETAPIRAAQMPRWLMATPEGSSPQAPATPPPKRGPEGSQRTHLPRPPREELLLRLEEHGWSMRATARYYDRDRKQISRWVEFYAIKLPGRES